MASEKCAAHLANAFTCSGEIHLLDDNPVREDEFGAHEALAEAVARLVEGEPGGKAIALEGAWGSGKSTVVELLKDRLEEGSKGKVLVFDGWAHEGDSLRRALVEELWEWIGDQKLIPPEDRGWKDLDGEVAGLARRRIEQGVKTTLRLTCSGRVMVALLALVPPGVALAARFAGWRCWLGLGLTASPFLLLLGFAVAIWLGKSAASQTKTQEEGPEEESSSWDRFDQVLGIFLRQVEKETKTQGWSTPDPTSIEFAGTFRKLLENVLRRIGDDRKLVVVLDNLDRLPGREAIRAFATLRVLFEPERQGTPWTERFWLLVPYDPTSLHGASAEGDSAPSALGTSFLEAAVAPATRSASDEALPKEIEKAFRQKFFQARFRLPQPVLLRWQEYLKNCLKKALPAHHEPALLENICALFTLVRDNDFVWAGRDSSKSARYTFPTPRDIKLFVNRLAAIHMQWPCEKAGRESTNDGQKHGGRSEIEPIPLILQAGFALCERRVTRDHDPWQADLSEYVPGLREKRFLEEAELRLIEKAVAEQSTARKEAKEEARTGQGEPDTEGHTVKEKGAEVEGALVRFEWERHVAAMWYGVPQGDALHMLLRPQILDAFSWGVLRDGWARDEMPYQKLLRSRDIGGFWEIAQAVAREHIGKPEANTLELCAKTLAVLGKWRDGSEGWNKAWRTAEGDAVRALGSRDAVLNPNRFSAVSGRNFAVAVGIPEVSRDLGAVGLEALSRAPGGAGQNFYQMWAQETVVVMDALVTREWHGEVLSFKVPHSPEAFIFLAGAAHGYSSLKKLGVSWVPSGGPDAIIGSLRETFEKGGFPVEYALAFDWLVEVHPDWPWERVADTVRAKLLGGQVQGGLRLPLVRGLRKLVDQRKATSEDWLVVLRSLKGSAIAHLVQTMKGEQQNATGTQKEQLGEEIAEWGKILAML